MYGETPRDGRSQTLERIVAIVADELMIDPSTVGPDTDCAEILERESLATLELLVRIEQEFGGIPDRAAIPMRTVRDLVDFIDSAPKRFLLRPAEPQDQRVGLLRPTGAPE